MFCSGVFAVFLSFDFLGASGPRNDSSRMSSPRYDTASCSAPTSRRGFPLPPPSPPPLLSPFFFCFCRVLLVLVFSRSFFLSLVCSFLFVFLVRPLCVLPVPPRLVAFG